MILRIWTIISLLWIVAMATFVGTDIPTLRALEAAAILVLGPPIFTLAVGLLLRWIAYGSGSRNVSGGSVTGLLPRSTNNG